MKERPILFQGAMVRALLAGAKTQTRRVMKHQPHDEATVTVEHFHQTVVDRHGDEQPGPEIFGAWWNDGENGTKCPYGGPGDRLWVKETWRTAKSLDADSPTAIAEKCLDAGYSTPWAPLAYDADGYRNGAWRGFELRGEAETGKTRVSIHMPRWASRITLEITSVHVERLQEISRGDAMDEGCPFPNMAQGDDPRRWYAELWDQINGAGSWGANPWVWVLEFRRVHS